MKIANRISGKKRWLTNEKYTALIQVEDSLLKISFYLEKGEQADCYLCDQPGFRQLVKITTVINFDDNSTVNEELRRKIFSMVGQLLYNNYGVCRKCASQHREAALVSLRYSEGVNLLNSA